MAGVDAGAQLSTLLTTEGLLFATFSLASSFISDPSRNRAWPIPGKWIVGLAVGVIAIVATGAVFAWEQVYVESGFTDDDTIRIAAVAILLAILVQPILAILLALSLRSEG